MDSNDLDSLRTKLVQLIDTISTLQEQLYYASLSTPEPTTSNPGILPWPELLSRYNLLLSHIVGLGGLLSSAAGMGMGTGMMQSEQEEGRKKKVEEGDRKRDKWEGRLVVPRVQVEESQDWIVGMLLRTKQTPEIEAHLENLLTSLPAAFTDPSTHEAAVKAHEELTERAYFKISKLKEGLDGEEWDWKGRVEVDEDEDSEEEDEEEGMEGSLKAGENGGEDQGMDVD